MNLIDQHVTITKNENIVFFFFLGERMPQRQNNSTLYFLKKLSVYLFSTLKSSLAIVAVNYETSF